MRPYLHPANIGFNVPPEAAVDILRNAAVLVRAVATTLAHTNDASFISAATQLRAWDGAEVTLRAADCQPLPPATTEILESAVMPLSRLVAVATRSSLAIVPTPDFSPVSDAELSLPLALLGGYGGRASWKALPSDAIHSWQSAQRALTEVQEAACALRVLVEQLGMPTLSGLCALLESLRELPSETSAVP